MSFLFFTTKMKQLLFAKVPIMKYFLKPLSVFSSTAILCACSVIPKPLNEVEITQAVHESMAQIQEATPEIKDKHLSLNHAIARSIKYNVESRLKTYENILAHTELTATNLDKLPQLAAQAGYIDRNNLNEVLSPVSGQVSTAEDRIRRVADLQFKWSLLDFGISYYMSKQKADQVLISYEEQRKIFQQLAKETASNFWKAYALQKHNYRAPKYRRELDEAINQSKQAQNENLLNPINANQYRRDMWQLASSIQSRKISLIDAKPKLMSLIHAPITQRNIRLTTTPQELVSLPRNFPATRKTLHQLALANRPEFLQGVYKKRISLDDIKLAQLNVLPNLNLSYGGFYDSNSYYVNNSWFIKTFNVAWDLLSIPHKLTKVTSSKIQYDIEQLKQLGLAIAILTQVDVAKAQFDEARDQLYFKSQILVNDTAIYDAMSNDANSAFKSKLATAKAYAQFIESQLAYDAAYADFRLAALNLLQSVGRDPVSQLTVYEKPVSDIIKEITALSTHFPLENNSSPKKTATTQKTKA